MKKHPGSQLFTKAFAALFVGAWCAGHFIAYAIVDANSQSNTSPPPDGSPWANVGTLNGGSGVYLGNGWVLTAAHIGIGTFHVAQADFPSDGTYYRLTNSDGSLTDMDLFHLSIKPNLPTLPLASSAPPASTQIDMIGYGRIAGSAQTNFGSFTGFYWSPTEMKSWGHNLVKSGGVTTINAGYGNVTAFATDFTQPGSSGATTDEGQAASGDSGGAAFESSGSTWLLAGMLDAISTYETQPANTAVYGNATYSANIATYRNQLLALMGLSAQPTLSIATSGTNVVVCWPDSGAGFNLEATPILSPAAWTTVAQNLSSTNGQGCILLPMTSSPRFFRLHKP